MYERMIMDSHCQSLNRRGRQRIVLDGLPAVFKTVGSGAVRASLYVWTPRRSGGTSPLFEGALSYSNAGANHAIWRHSAALNEFEPPFLNGRHRSVNRKVQGSSPCPGAKFRIWHRRVQLYAELRRTATLQQRVSDSGAD